MQCREAIGKSRRAQWNAKMDRQEIGALLSFSVFSFCKCTSYGTFSLLKNDLLQIEDEKGNVEQKPQHR